MLGGHLQHRSGAMRNLGERRKAEVRLRTISLRRTPVNKSVPGLSAPLSVVISSKAQNVRVGLHQPQEVLLGGLEDALRGSPSCAEGGHKRAVVLAVQYDYVRVRLVQIVVELGH